MGQHFFIPPSLLHFSGRMCHRHGTVSSIGFFFFSHPATQSFLHDALTILFAMLPPKCTVLLSSQMFSSVLCAPLSRSKRACMICVYTAGCRL
jgi:hypothetical protein